MWPWLQSLLLGMVSVAVVLVFTALLLMQVLGVGAGLGMGPCLGLLAGAIPTYLGLIVAHEIGHLVAGKAVGLSFSRFTVGLVALERIGGRLRVLLNTEWFRPAAYVLYLLPGERPSAWRWAVTVAGGPLANLLIGALCLIVATVLHPGPPEMVARAARAGWRSVPLLMPGSLATAWLNVAASVSLGLGLLTLIPGRAAGMRTDGGHLLDLIRGRDVFTQSGLPTAPPSTVPWVHRSEGK